MSVLRKRGIYCLKKGKVLRIDKWGSYVIMLRENYIGWPEPGQGRKLQRRSRGRESTHADCGVVFILVTTEVR